MSKTRKLIIKYKLKKYYKMKLNDKTETKGR